MSGERYAIASALQGWRASGTGTALLEGQGFAAEVAVADDGSVRLRAHAGAKLPADPAPGIGREPWSAARCAPEPRDGGGLRLRHEGPLGSVEVGVEPGPPRLRVFDRRGQPVAELGGLAFDAQGGARIELDAGREQRFFGLGELHGGLDKRGEEIRLRNRDPELRDQNPMYVSIPFLMGLSHGSGGGRAFGLLLDAFGPTRFDVAASRPDRVALETRTGGLDLTIFPGPLPADVLRRFTARVGRTPLPPLWALGHHQSRWGYRNARDLRRVARELRARSIPSDALHLDIDHMRGFRNFTFDPDRFPDPRGLLRELAEQGFRAVAIVDAGLKVDPEWEVYAEGARRDAFCRRADGSEYSLRVWPGDAALPDFNREDVRDWWGEQHRPLLEAGVAGIWNDMNEPAGWKRDIRLGRRLMLPVAGQDLRDVVQCDPSEPAQKRAHEQLRNIYGYQECRATRAYLEAAQPDRRAFVLTRSGFAGIQRYAAVWTGDNRSRWHDLRESIPMLLNLSLSGVAFCGADIGGFFGSANPELYARWIQLGALYPFARTHSVLFSRPQEAWRFGPRVEAIAREALRLRMRLLPYLAQLFRESEASGAPVWRALFYEFPEDPESAGVEDQLMLGPALLVAPVVQRGARERELYLPPGLWYSWQDDARYVGPRRIRVPAPLERMPIFARAGALLPTRSAVAHAAERPEEPFCLHVFPGADGAGEWVEDDGETLAYRRGVVARTSARLWSRAGGRLRLELGPREGSFEVAPRPARVHLHACPPPSSVWLDGAALAEGEGQPGYRASQGQLWLHFEDAGQGRVLEVDPAP